MFRDACQNLRNLLLNTGCAFSILTVHFYLNVIIDTNPYYFWPGSFIPVNRRCRYSNLEQPGAPQRPYVNRKCNNSVQHRTLATHCRRAASRDQMDQEQTWTRSEGHPAWTEKVNESYSVRFGLHSKRLAYRLKNKNCSVLSLSETHLHFACIYSGSIVISSLRSLHSVCFPCTTHQSPHYQLSSLAMLHT